MAERAKKILVATSDASTADELKSFIDHSEYDVFVSRDRSEIFQLQKDEHPSIIIVDHPIGKNHGVELLKELLDGDPCCDVVLVSSEGDFEDAIEALRIGALDYLQKPINKDRLLETLQRGFERTIHRRALVEAPCVLVIEDHEPTLRRLVSILQKEGYTVFSACDGEEGIRIFNSTRLDVILVDIRMPRKGGIEVLKETKGNGADLEVIVITGHGDENIVVEAMREGAINFLKKPVDIEEMLLAIQKAIDHQMRRRSVAFRNRDFEFARDFIIRLTHRHELVIEKPDDISLETRDFLQRLIDAFRIDIVIANSNRHIIYANDRVVNAIGDARSVLDADGLYAIGVEDVTQARLRSAFDNTMRSDSGSIETLIDSEKVSVIMTPLNLNRPNGSEKCVVVAIHDKRRS